MFSPILWRRTWVTACAPILFLSGLTACSPAPQSPPLTEAEKQLQVGQQKSRMCAGCHGPQGISRVSSYPSLAGKSQQYLFQQLRAFRRGERSNSTMEAVTRNLSEDELKALSYYYASLSAPVDESVGGADTASVPGKAGAH